MRLSKEIFPKPHQLLSPKIRTESGSNQAKVSDRGVMEGMNRGYKE